MILNTLIYEKLSMKEHLISKGISTTLQHCEEVATVINCDYCEKMMKELQVMD
jgi:aspartate carbamoyltransferase regulatory subunit